MPEAERELRRLRRPNVDDACEHCQHGNIDGIEPNDSRKFLKHDAEANDCRPKQHADAQSNELHLQRRRFPYLKGRMVQAHA